MNSYLVFSGFVIMVIVLWLGRPRRVWTAKGKSAQGEMVLYTIYARSAVTARLLAEWHMRGHALMWLAVTPGRSDIRF